MTSISFLLTALYLLVNMSTRSAQSTAQAKQDFPTLGRKYGYKVQEYNVTTEDGYILKMFHIPGDKNKPVLIMHGLADSADSFILRGRKSLAAILANKGYDVFLGNSRGNKYSRRHERLNPDTDKEFWNFSFHEMGVYDLPVLIDFILRENNVANLSYIGHSQGNTMLYVLGSSRPEYNDKINVAIALGPVCYLNIANLQFPMTTIIRSGPAIIQWLKDRNEEEVFGNNSLPMRFKESICAQKSIGYDVCGIGIFGLIGGDDFEEFEPEFFYSVIDHYPTSTSRKAWEHFMQVAMRKQFAPFDYGSEKNLEKYKSKQPPPYDLSKVTMKVALLLGKNDLFTPIANVVLLKEKLPNVVLFHVMEREKFNHIDHVWGKHMYKYLFPLIIEVLEKHG